MIAVIEKPRSLPEVAVGSDRVGVIIPTYNAALYWSDLQGGIDRQGISPEQVLVIDSSSNDGTPDLAKAAGYQLLTVMKSDFSHGGTRQLGCKWFSQADLLIYLTQDALLPGDGAFQKLCSVFVDPGIGAACGRQLSRPGADAIERHARLFNYPDVSTVRSFADRKQFGIKTAFLSNSFAAYRRSALEEIGGFPADVILAEDSVVAARMLLAGWKIAYTAEAAVIHSHGLSIREEFSRYFDTGVHHARESWIRESFGEAGSEGKRFLLSEISYVSKTRARLLPMAFMRTVSKLVAYRLGLREKFLPKALKESLSLQSEFWNRLR